MSQVATYEQKHMEELDCFIDSLPDKRGALISVLHRAQEIFGYLPQEVQSHIATKLNVPSSKVFGVVSFYSFLKTEPKGRISVSVCMGTACFVRGSEAVLKEFEKQLGIKAGETSADQMFSLESIRCVGACGLAPVVTVDGQVFGRVQAEDVKHIVDERMAKEGLEDGHEN